MLDEYQKKAFNFALKNNFTAINARAGTGKSFTALAIEQELNKQGWIVSKVAPTGKAAVRVGGLTVHKWLDPQILEVDQFGNIKKMKFLKTQMYNKECLIIDECSMIDNELWDKIHEVVNNSWDKEIKVIYIGDTGQLEPVGEGYPFIKWLQSNQDKTFELQQVHRNSDGNDIVNFANCVRDNTLCKKSYNNVSNTTTAQAFKSVIKDCKDHQLVAPSNAYVNLWNKVIQRARKLEGEVAYNTLRWQQGKDSKWKLVKDQTIYVGDKILITKNDFCFNITNGTTGIVLGKCVTRVKDWALGIMRDMEAITMFNLDTKEVMEIPINALVKTSTLGYCVTVHKMQGSESKYVYLWYLDKYHKMLQNKKLVYTAITRAQEHFFIVTHNDFKENIPDKSLWDLNFDF